MELGIVELTKTEIIFNARGEEGFLLIVLIKVYNLYVDAILMRFEEVFHRISDFGRKKFSDKN
jgi:hypothetical protein